MGNYVTIYEEYKHKFFQLPKVFFTNDKYKDMSNNSKIAWALLRDRSSLSKKNKWFDKDTGKVYFIYTNKDLMEILNIKSSTTVTAIRKELREANLIEEKDRGFNQPKKVYLLYPEITDDDIYSIDNIENYNYEEKEEKATSNQAGQGVLKNGSPKNDSPVSQNMTPSNTDVSDTDLKDLDTVDTKDTNSPSKNEIDLNAFSSQTKEKERLAKKQEYMDNAFYDNNEFIPKQLSVMLKAFFRTTDEAKKHYDIILMAKNKVEKETNTMIWLEHEPELMQDIIDSFSRAIKKIEHSNGIKDKNAYLYVSIYQTIQNEINNRYREKILTNKKDGLFDYDYMNES